MPVQCIPSQRWRRGSDQPSVTRFLRLQRDRFLPPKNWSTLTQSVRGKILSRSHEWLQRQAFFESAWSFTCWMSFTVKLEGHKDDIMWDAMLHWEWVKTSNVLLSMIACTYARISNPPSTPLTSDPWTDCKLMSTMTTSSSTYRPFQSFDAQPRQNFADFEKQVYDDAGAVGKWQPYWPMTLCGESHMWYGVQSTPEHAQSILWPLWLHVLISSHNAV